MCQKTSKYEKVKTAENDIVVYKIVNKFKIKPDEENPTDEILFEEYRCCSIFQLFIYEKDVKYITNNFDDKIIRMKERLCDHITINEEGYHSFIEGPQKEFIYKGIYVGKDLSVILAESLEKENKTYARFVIPKGSKYIEGVDDYNNKTYVSDSIVFVELLHWDFKNNYYGRHQENI